VRVTPHALAQGEAVIPCTTWCTEGLAAFGHPELTLTLRRPEGADEDTLSLDAIRFLVALHGAVTEGRTLSAGSLGELPAGSFDSEEPYGFVCVHPGRSPDPSAPTSGLRVVVLHRDELALACTFGPWRVLARLARATRWVPFPPWWDATRPSVVHPDDTRSVLARALRVRVLHAAAWRNNQTVTLCVAPEARAGLRAVVPRMGEAPSFALLVDAPADADAWLVWKPEQQGVTAASRAQGVARKVAGGFVLILHGEGNPVGCHVEDGFAFVLDAETRQALLDALAEGRGFDLAPGPRWLGLRLVWEAPETLPQGAPAARLRGVDVLAGLGDDPAVDPQAFARYARSVCAAVEDHFMSTCFEPGWDLMVHVELHPGRRPMASVALRPGIAHPMVNGLCASVESVAAPEVTGAVVFRVEFALWGGAQ